MRWSGGVDAGLDCLKPSPTCCSVTSLSLSACAQQVLGAPIQAVRTPWEAAKSLWTMANTCLNAPQMLPIPSAEQKVSG